MQLQYQNTLKHLSYALLAAISLMATNSFAEDTITADAVTGFVTATSPNGDTKRVNNGDELQEGDTITTGEDSSVSIVLADGTVIDLGASSTYTIPSSTGGGGDDDDMSGGGDSKDSSSPSLSTGTSAGGGISDEDDSSPTPGPGGSPTG